MRSSFFTAVAVNSCAASAHLCEGVTSAACRQRTMQWEETHHAVRSLCGHTEDLVVLEHADLAAIQELCAPGTAVSPPSRIATCSAPASVPAHLATPCLCRRMPGP